MLHVAQASLAHPELQSLGSSHRVLNWCVPEESLVIAFTEFLAELGVTETPTVCKEFVGRVYANLHYQEEEASQVVFACYLVKVLYTKQRELELALEGS